MTKQWGFGLRSGCYAGAMMLVGVSTALAQTNASPLPKHMPLKQEACFGRDYDTAHLARNGAQQVTSLYLFRDFAVDTNSEYPPDDPKQLQDVDGDDGRINLDAYVRLRGRQGVYSNSFSCSRNNEGRIFCGIDCDGGSFTLRADGEGLGLANQGFVVVGGCGGTDEEQKNSVNVLPGTADKTFRLTPQPLAACTAMRDARKPAFANQGQPIRARLATPEARCFARSYDAAHLAAHPKQQVRRIAVVKPKDEAYKPDDYPVHNLTFKIERRDGKTFETAAECSPDSYVYACTEPKSGDDTGFHLARAGDKDIMLRDRRGVLASLLKAGLGADDKSFKLTEADENACKF
jgi:hypothetical protein